MAKFTSTDWDDIRKKFHHSIMADTSLVSLAENLDSKAWPHAAEDEKPSKYIDFTYEELLLMPEIAGKVDRADQLIGILKETLAFDDPFGDMVAQVEQTSAKDNPILKTLAHLGIPEEYPLALANFTEGTRTVCESEGVKTIGGFANLGQQMSTRVVLGGDFRMALNALTHGDEEGIAKFLPFRKGATGLHLAEAIGLAAAALPRPEQLALAKYYGAKLGATEAVALTPLSKEQAEKHESTMRPMVQSALDWFKDEKAALIKHLSDGGTFERYFVVLNDPAREAIAIRQAGGLMKIEAKAATPAAEKKGGFFTRMFRKG